MKKMLESFNHAINGIVDAAGISKGELNHKEVQETADKVAKSFKELVAKVVVNM